MNIKISTHDKWKCPDCGMTERKEPHNRLKDHMLENMGSGGTNLRILIRWNRINEQRRTTATIGGSCYRSVRV